MATGSNGLIYENRTLQFYGFAYGNTTVSLKATINGTDVFAGEVATINAELPPPPLDIVNAPLLFSVADSTLFPTNWAGSYPMTIAVNSGSGIVLGTIFSNYMQYTDISSIPASVMENSSINGNVLTVGTLTSGTIEIQQVLTGTGIPSFPRMTIVGNNSSSGSTWKVASETYITVPSTTISGYKIVEQPGTSTKYTLCYAGIPANSENTLDPCSSVAIDGVAQVPPAPVSQGIYAWAVPVGSTISYNLNVGIGSCAQV